MLLLDHEHTFSDCESFKHTRHTAGIASISVVSRQVQTKVLIHFFFFFNSASFGYCAHFSLLLPHMVLAGPLCVTAT